LAGTVSALAVLAAVVPICGSLYAGASFLAHQAELAHEARVRQRLKPLIEAQPSASRADFERMMLAYNGITRPGTTWDEWDLSNKMSGHRVPARELRRQWVLLLTSAAGLVLLALDLVGS
jgi:hypothetical protein